MIAISSPAAVMPLCSSASLILASSLLLLHLTAACYVTVHEPWPTPYVFVPRHSTVEMHCTENSDFLNIWSVDLGSDTLGIQYRGGDGKLTDHGIYELPALNRSGIPSILRLRINDTDVNNETQIFCNMHSTTLLVYEPAPLNAEVLQKDTHAINISWNQDPSLEAQRQEYQLAISNGSNHQEISLNKTYYYFRFPSNAPPCEVYNFSVTATPVGATYTGDGCSASSSPMLSTTVPSLPSTEKVEASLDYSLEKVAGALTLNISFEPASNCEASSYSLEITDASTDALVQLVNLTSDGTNSVRGNLSGDEVYVLRIFVSNAIGTVPTSNRTLYTTDVQNATVTLKEDKNTSLIRCDFITGSDAHGCVVTLKSLYSDEELLTLRRNSTTNSASLVTYLKHPPACYYEMHAFDVQSDGSIGAVAFPVRLVGFHKEKERPCPNKQLPVSSQESDLSWWIIAVVAILLVSVLIVTIPIVALILISKADRLKVCRLRSVKSVSMSPTSMKSYSDKYHSDYIEDPTMLTTGNKEELEESIPVYDQILPGQQASRQKGSTQLSGGAEADYSTTVHCVRSINSLQRIQGNPDYSTLGSFQEEHFYHVLETGPSPSRDTHSISHPELSCHGDPPDSPPVYDEILDLRRSRVRSCDSPPRQNVEEEDGTNTSLSATDLTTCSSSDPESPSSTSTHTTATSSGSTVALISSETSSKTKPVG